MNIYCFLVNCTAHALDDDSYLVMLDEPRRALTVGQVSAFTQLSYLG